MRVRVAQGHLNAHELFRLDVDHFRSSWIPLEATGARKAWRWQKSWNYSASAARLDQAVGVACGNLWMRSAPCRGRFRAGQAQCGGDADGAEGDAEAEREERHGGQRHVAGRHERMESKAVAGQQARREGHTSRKAEARGSR